MVEPLDRRPGGQRTANEGVLDRQFRRACDGRVAGSDHLIDSDRSGRRCRGPEGGACAAERDGGTEHILRDDGPRPGDAKDRLLRARRSAGNAAQLQIAVLRGQLDRAGGLRVDDIEPGRVGDRDRRAQRGHMIAERIAVACGVGLVAVKIMACVVERDIEIRARPVARGQIGVAGDVDRTGRAVRDRPAARHDYEIARIGRLRPAVHINRVVRRRVAMGGDGAEFDSVGCDKRDVLARRADRASEVMPVSRSVIIKRDVEIVRSRLRGQRSRSADGDRGAGRVGNRARRRHSQRSGRRDRAKLNAVLRAVQRHVRTNDVHRAGKIIARVGQRHALTRCRDCRHSFDVQRAAVGHRAARRHRQAGRQNARQVNVVHIVKDDIAKLHPGVPVHRKGAHVVVAGQRRVRIGANRSDD